MKRSRFVKGIIKAWNLLRFEFSLIIPAFFYSLFGYVTLVGFYGLGDVIYELAYLDEYIEKSHKKIRVAVTKKRRHMFLFYPQIKKVGRLSPSLEQLIIELGYNKYIKRRYLKIILHYNGHNEGDIFSRVRNIYGVSENTKITFPTPYKMEEINIPNNSVLVIPNSNWYSSKKIEDVISSLASDLLKNNKNVFINGEALKLEGANNVFYDLNTLLCNAHKFEYIISIRTGLLDFLVNTDSRIITFLDNSEKGLILLKDGLPSKDWHAKASVKEINVDEVSLSDIKKVVGLK